MVDVPDLELLHPSPSPPIVTLIIALRLVPKVSGSSKPKTKMGTRLSGVLGRIFLKRNCLGWGNGMEGGLPPVSGWYDRGLFND